MRTRRQLMLLGIGDRLARLVSQIDPHPYRVNTCSSPLGLVGLWPSVLVREDPDDLADEDAAVASLMALAAGVPTAEQERHGAALQQRASMGHGGVPQLPVLLDCGCRFSVDGAGSDLPIEGPVR